MGERVRVSRFQTDPLPKARTNEGGHFHAVKFYENRESLCRMISEFLGEGFIGQQLALVIATPEHRAGILDELRTRHFDVDGMQSAGELLVLDAEQALSTFMVGGMPDADLFNRWAIDAMGRVCRDSTRPIRAYGEMVDLLWKANHTVAAVRLEMLWNQLAATHDFSLLCGYSMGSFYKGAHLAEICDHHTHVVSGAGVPVARERQIRAN